MFEDNPNQLETMSTQDVFEFVQAQVKDGNGGIPFYVGVPFRDGVGLEYLGVKQLSNHEGMVDLTTTVPTMDNVKE